MASREKYVTRLIYFYRIVPLDRGDISKFSPDEVCEALRKLDDNDRYLPSGDLEFCAVPDALSDRIRFGKIRRDQLPHIERRGKVEALKLASDEGLFESVHVLFLPGGVVAADFNLYGPRMQHLSEYLLSKTPQVFPMTFARLIHGDALAKLERFTSIRLLEIRLDPSHAEVFIPVEAHLPEALGRLKSNLGAGSITLKLQVERRSRKPLTGIKERLLEIVQHTNFQDATDLLKIRAVPDAGGRVETIDLLEDELVKRVELPRKIIRNPEAYAERMYAEMETAYYAMESDIRAAAAMQVTFPDAKQG